MKDIIYCEREGMRVFFHLSAKYLNNKNTYEAKNIYSEREGKKVAHFFICQQKHFNKMKYITYMRN